MSDHHDFKKAHRKTRLWGIVFFVVAAIVVATMTFLIPKQISEDSGISACKAIADDSMHAATYGDTPMSGDDYKKMRDVFVNSGYQDLRDAGTKFVSIAYQVSQVPPGTPGYDAFILQSAQPLISAYYGLFDACANHDVMLPSLSELTDVRKLSSASPTTRK